MEVLKNDKTRNIFISFSVIGLVALIAGAYFSTRQHNQNATIAPQVSVAGSPNVSVVPGDSPSKEYNLAQKDQNDKDAKLAISGGKSFEPKITNNDALKEKSPIDTLTTVKAPEIPEPVVQPVEIAVVEPDLTVAPVTPVIKAPPAVVEKTLTPALEKSPARYTAEQYSLIMSLTKAHQNRGTAIETDYTGENKNKSQNGGGAINGNSNVALVDNSVVFLKAGDMVNAVLETEIKSDEPSPVLARIVGGKYNGAKAVCGLQSNGEKVLVQCTKLNIAGLSKSVSVSMVAVDPTTTRTGLATDVDHHYFQKYVVGLGAAFVKGYAEALTRQNTTTSVNALGGVTVVQGSLSSKDITKQGIGEMGKTIGDDIKQSASNLKPTVYVAAGTAIGLMALDDLLIK